MTSPPYGSTSPTEPSPPPLSDYDAEDKFSINSLWNQGYVSNSDLASIENPATRHYYASQNALLDQMSKAMDSVCGTSPASAVPQTSPFQNTVQRAIMASNIGNAFLLFAQLYAFISSSSLAMLAVFIDALLDAVSGVVVTCTWYLRTRKDRIRYPVGRKRLEPLGVIALACLMTAATLMTLEESIGALLEKNHPELSISLSTCVILLIALTTKASLFSFCRMVEDDSVQALAEDHFNDCLSNIVTLITVFLSKYLVWWIDPLGAIIISLLIIRNWVLHTLHHCDQLLGKVASPKILNLITFVVCNHSVHIKQVDTVTAYHVGSGIYTEVHIVLDKDMPLSIAHDVGESLQNRIEQLDHIERCFVHLDVESRHSPSIEHKDI